MWHCDINTLDWEHFSESALQTLLLLLLWLLLLLLFNTLCESWLKVVILLVNINLLLWSESYDKYRK